jgi:cell division protein FtsB
MAAENERHTSQTIRTLLHQRREASAWNAWQTQNEALAAENAQLRQELADYKRNYAELDAWARRAERQIAQLEQLNQKNR